MISQTKAIAFVSRPKTVPLNSGGFFSFKLMNFTKKKVTCSGSFVACPIECCTFLKSYLVEINCESGYFRFRFNMLSYFTHTHTHNLNL